MSMKKKYYSMKNEDFINYLNTIKNNDNTISIFSSLQTPYFYMDDRNINNHLLELNNLQFQLDTLFHSFTNLQQNMIEQSCFIDEVQSTNSTENIYSTQSDVLEILNDVKRITNKKIVSIVNSYISIKNIELNDLYTIPSIRQLYDLLMEEAYEKSKDQPDGMYFRKGTVLVTNGLKTVHSGFYPEENIMKGMEEYIQFIQREDINIYLMLILSHFMIETIHPFYDGNGRFGRFLMSVNLYGVNKSIYSFSIATSINNNKKKYYKALEIGRDRHEFGCLNEYVKDMSEILLSGMKELLDTLSNYKKILTERDKIPFTMTKSEKQIYDLLYDASILTYFGISNTDILKYTDVSKRTLMNTLKKFRSHNILIDMKLGKVQYHKVKGEFI